MLHRFVPFFKAEFSCLVLRPASGHSPPKQAHPPGQVSPSLRRSVHHLAHFGSAGLGSAGGHAASDRTAARGRHGEFHRVHKPRHWQARVDLLVMARARRTDIKASLTQ